MVLTEEVTIENIQYYREFVYYYDIYVNSSVNNPLNSPEHIDHVSNMIDAFCRIPEVAKKAHNID